MHVRSLSPGLTTGRTAALVVHKVPAGEVARICLVFLGVGLGAYLLWRLQEVVFLVLLAILLATAIEPIVNQLRRGPFSRGSGVLVVYTTIMLVLGIAAYETVPNVVSQASSFLPSLPDRLEALRGQVTGVEQPAVSNALIRIIDQAQHAVQQPGQPPCESAYGSLVPRRLRLRVGLARTCISEDHGIRFAGSHNCTGC